MNSRVMPINDAKPASSGKVVVYVMSRDQRVHDNHALLEAQASALEQKLPLVVVFNLLNKSGVRAREHFEFMLVGLKEVEKNLKKHNIGFALTFGDNHKNLSDQLKDLEPVAVYFDFSPLRGPKAVHKAIADSVSYPCFVVDTHNIIPAWEASEAEEFAAHTFRSKVHKKLADRKSTRLNSSHT